MSEVATPHPSPEQLAAFSLGKSLSGEALMIAVHLGRCRACQKAVAAVPDDSLLSLLRKVVPGQTQSCLTGDSWMPTELVGHPRYRLISWLGAGGRGVVYKAEDRLAERPVAIKVIAKKLTVNPAAVQRFQRNAKAAAKLSHANVVTVYDTEQAGDLHFLVMEFVEGVNLARLVEERGPLPADLACDYTRQVALGLLDAHKQGLAHRDIKPQNLMLTPAGQLKILDFGLAGFVAQAGSASITEFGQDRPADDAPEEIQDASTADILADIYGLGCTLYFLLAGHSPFPECTEREKVSTHLERLAKALCDFRPDLPAGLGKIVERMVSQKSVKQYQTTSKVIDALRAIKADKCPSKHPSKWPLTLAVILLVIAMVAVLVLI